MTLSLSKLMAVADRNENAALRKGLSLIVGLLAKSMSNAGLTPAECDAADSYIADARRLLSSDESTFDPPTVKRLLAIAAAAKDMIAHDGGDGAEDYHAFKLGDARIALRASLEGVEL